MPFRISKAPHVVWQEVTLTYLDEGGAVTKAKVRLQFELLDDEAVAAGLSRGEAAFAMATAQDRERNLDFIVGVTRDWKEFQDDDGAAEPFDPQRFRELLQHPWFAEPVTQAYFAARRGRRAGN